ncbi:bifunctional cobalt-precorrin-7 (C(5))-methyltransferase/cobalt-precorrin-6B (C(15))-methyltransferase [Calothrix sp. 336/3]|uniref:bifunctional cobalt-precorrin-7 (C(5))-methyltransferase/cobalt-precorrin-6B (C(15))-methyltransferase n=1 Tax=Calothrix sp. 336/3 TaxID=1337936 RepID=UPI0004E4420D|nr:bifunctional cobalt-precorrin-7 (C(5))-methyltransferase/cobalt-precorrin-6B (C(15))-methyltransferase [Calothrix sp. 336/3]AKG24845.1 precorrin-6Y C5,15-methyltransferase [Calothrix sp. 336/3]
MTQEKWLSVIGIGEDGLSGLSAIAVSLLSQARVICGGDRHLAMLPPQDKREKILWSSPLNSSLEAIIQRRGEKVCVLASGDPLCFGIGVTLSRKIPISEMTIIPTPSAFSLACARLGWSLPEVESLSLCGRPAALLQAAIYPGAKILVLSADRTTPATVADILTKRGYGDSKITILERMGGSQERILSTTAASFEPGELADLNTIAVECLTHGEVFHLARSPGLPDTAYHHDGQLTKREIRAITLSSLAPLPGQLLWDVGAGCGSIGIEWMRTHPRCQAIAIEQNSTRLQHIADNAAALGTPNLQILPGKAPTVLENLPTADAIFIGGGITVPSLFESCWQGLRPGGRLVANAVTLESEYKILQLHQQYGGELTRISVQRTAPIGSFLGWKTMAPITHWLVNK